MRVITVFVALSFLALGVSSAEHRRFTPRFTLEQITETRTLGQFTISPDGARVAYTIAGYYYGFSVIPRFGEDNNIRVVSLASGEIRKLTSGPSPKTNPRFSPSGERVAFEAEGDIWIAEVATGAVKRVTGHLANDRSPTWSPDETRIAFVSNRPAEGRSARTDVWVVSAEGESHELFRLTDDGAVEEDPQWSPDGGAVAFTARRPDEHFYAKGIFRVPAAGGTVTRLTSPDATTNFAPRWSSDGRRLAYLSDRSGYVHAWTMSPDGRDQREFDTGPHDSVSPHFAVAPVWSPDGRGILVSFNREGSFDLAVLDAETGRVETIATGGGQYHEVGFTAEGEVVYSYENAWSPPDLYVRPRLASEPRQLTFSSHATFRKEHFANVERVALESLDGPKLGGFLLTPTGSRPGERLPAVVNIHTNSYGQFYDHWGPFFHYLVQSGYVMLMVDQRGSAGYGRAFREAAIGAWGTKTLDDVKAMAAYIKALPSVDPERVGVMGLSHGGYMTLLALTKVPELFRAGVDLMGPTDRRTAFLNRNRRLHIGERPTEEETLELYNRVSPISSVADLRAPLLILHSDRDRNVAPSQTYAFVDELERHHKPHELVMYPDEAHGLADPEHQRDSYRRIVGFFHRYLGQKR